MTVSQRRRFCSALLITMVYLAFLNSLNGILLNDVIDEYQLSGAAYMGVTGSIGSMLALLSSLVLLGKMPKRLMLLVACCVPLLALLLLRFSPTFGMFMLFNAISCFGTGYMDPLLSSNMADLYTGRQGSKMMGVLHTTFSIGAVAVPIICSAVLAHIRRTGGVWKDLYLFVAGIAVVVIAIYFLCLPKGKSEQAVVAEAGNAKMSWALLKSKLQGGILPGLMLAMMLHNVFFSGILNWINRYIGVTLSSDLGDIAMSFMWAGVMASRILVPMLPIKTERYLCGAGFITGGIVIAGVLCQNAVCMCVATALCGLSFGAMLTCMINVGCEASRENTLLATTALSLAMSLGGMTVAPVMSWLESAFNLHVGMVCLAGAVILTSTVLILIPGIRKAAKG